MEGGNGWLESEKILVALKRGQGQDGDAVDLQNANCRRYQRAPRESAQQKRRFVRDSGADRPAPREPG